VVGVHLYSNSTVLSRSGAVSNDPLRMRVVNSTHNKVRWVTLAYILKVEAKLLQTREEHEVRAELLQWVWPLFFRACMVESHRRTWLQLPSVRRACVSPSVLLYVFGRPDERASMC